MRRLEERMSDETPQAGETVLVEKYSNDCIWVVTMNRPHRMNAFGDGMTDKLAQAFSEYRDSPAARVAILTGAGDRAFSAGGDLKEMSQGPRADAPSPLRGRGLPMAPLSEKLDLWKPTIAALNCYALAGGFMMAMQCDIRRAGRASLPSWRARADFAKEEP
jgi:enoyl-CoA hydratase/carnithine racemase